MFHEHQIGILAFSEGSCDTEDWSYDAKTLLNPNYLMLVDITIINN